MSEEHEIMMGKGKKSAKVMFVVDAPTEDDYYEDEYLIDKAGNLLRTALEQLDISIKDDCFFTGLVKYGLPDDRPPLKNEIEECEDYLKAEIQIVNPDIIVPMGNVALKKILGSTGITKFRGKATEKDDRIIFPIVHPSMVFAQPKHMQNFTTDLTNLKELMEKGKDFLAKREVKYKYLQDLKTVVAEIKRMMDSEWVVFDLETTGLNPFLDSSKIVCISLTDKTHYGVTIPLEHKDFTWPAKVLEKIKLLLKVLLENQKIKKMAHNGKFDIKWLGVQYGIEVENLAFDPMLVHYLTVSEERGGHGLKDLAWEHTDMGGYDNDLDAFKQTLSEADRHNYDNIPWEILREYAAADVDCTFRLYEKFKDRLIGNAGWRDVFDQIMVPGSYMLSDIERNGIKMSEDKLSNYEEVFPKRTSEIEEKLRQYPEIVLVEREKLKLYEMRQIEMKKPKEERDKEILKYNKYKNFSFNFGSVNNLRELLFEKLGLDTPFLTDKGEERKKAIEKKNRRIKDKKKKEKFEPTINELSTGKETLEYLEDKHPISSLLAEWRRLEKVYGTYVKPARNWIGSDGLVHPTFMLHGTVTGRTASEAPKLVGHRCGNVAC